jgi:Spy/CpxP family protein refolding chaperone
MKTYLSFPRAALLALALGTTVTSAALADDTTTTTPATPPASDEGHHHHHDKVLTADEKAQLEKAHDAALAANPDLKTEEDSLKQEHESLGSDATADQKKDLFTKWQAFHEKMKAAELQIDPTLAPIFAKLDAAHKDWHKNS